MQKLVNSFTLNYNLERRLLEVPGGYRSFLQTQTIPDLLSTGGISIP